MGESTISRADLSSRQRVRSLVQHIADAALARFRGHLEEPELDAAAEIVTTFLRGNGPLNLGVANCFLFWQGSVVYHIPSASKSMAALLYRDGVRRIELAADVPVPSARSFLQQLATRLGSDDRGLSAALWRAGVPGVQIRTIEAFGERIRLGEDRALRTFRRVLDDVVPGLSRYEDDDKAPHTAETPPHAPTTHTTLEEISRPQSAEAEERPSSNPVRVAAELIETIGTSLHTAAGPARALLDNTGTPKNALKHMVRLLGSLAVKWPSPLEPGHLLQIVNRVLRSHLEHLEWWGFAEASRTMLALADSAEEFPSALRPTLAGLKSTVAGPSAVDAVARSLRRAGDEFAMWAQLHFGNAGEVSVEEVMSLTDATTDFHANLFLRDLLTRVQAGGLTDFGESLRDENEEVALDALEVIIANGLGLTARPHLLKALGHPSSAVRGRTVEALSSPYSRQVRAALLPLLRDSDRNVRESVVCGLAHIGDTTSAPYLAKTIRSPFFGTLDADEQQLYLEGLARLGGDRFIDVFRELIIEPLVPLDPTGPHEIRPDREGDAAPGSDAAGTCPASGLPTARAAVYGLVCLKSDLSRRAFADVERRGSGGLRMLCSDLRKAMGEGRSIAQLTTTGLATRWGRESAAGSRREGTKRMGDRLLFEPRALRRAVDAMIRSRRGETASWTVGDSPGGRPAPVKDVVLDGPNLATAAGPETEPAAKPVVPNRGQPDPTNTTASDLIRPELPVVATAAIPSPRRNTGTLIGMPAGAETTKKPATDLLLPDPASVARVGSHAEPGGSISVLDETIDVGAMTGPETEPSFPPLVDAETSLDALSVVENPRDETSEDSSEGLVESSAHALMRSDPSASAIESFVPAGSPEERMAHRDRQSLDELLSSYLAEEVADPRPRFAPEPLSSSERIHTPEPRPTPLPGLTKPVSRSGTPTGRVITPIPSTAGQRTGSTGPQRRTPADPKTGSVGDGTPYSANREAQVPDEDDSSERDVGLDDLLKTFLGLDLED